MPKLKAAISAKTSDKRVERITRYLELDDRDVEPPPIRVPGASW
ncbi:hypothetical protein ACFVVU_35815 [Kitasatospora sp. NPDC057965]